MNSNYNQNQNFINENFSPMLPVADEKYSNIKILDQKVNSYKNSPFSSQKSPRKQKVKEDGSLFKNQNQNEGNSEYSEERSEDVNKKKRMNEMINYISEPINNVNKNYKKLKTQQNFQPKMNFLNYDSSKKSNKVNNTNQNINSERKNKINS